MKVKSLSCVRLFEIPRTVAHQAPLSMEFSRQEYWSGLPFSSPGDSPDPGIKPRSPALQANALLSEPPGRQDWFKINRDLMLPGAAAAKSLQLCLTLCDPTDGSPPGSPVPGILQARTLEGVAISFSNAWKWKVKASWWLSGKESTCQCRRPGFDPWVEKVPWSRRWLPTPVFLWRIPGTEEPGGLHSMRLQRVRHDWMTKHACMHDAAGSKLSAKAMSVDPGGTVWGEGSKRHLILRQMEETGFP